jgi:L-ribulose-5-phosphate 4-epimerase
MKYEDIRRQVLTAIRQASAQGLIHGTSGNISVRDREAGVAAITPSGRPYDTMEPGDIAIVTLDGEWVDGPYAPSSETPMHTAVYRAPTWGRWCITTPCSAP